MSSDLPARVANIEKLVIRMDQKQTDFLEGLDRACRGRHQAFLAKIGAGLLTVGAAVIAIWNGIEKLTLHLGGKP
jgi:hypothetical protein